MTDNRSFISTGQPVLRLRLSPWLCVAGNCELVYPALASQRVWGWILWAACWRAAPAPSSASLPAGAPSSAAPTDVPGKQTTAAASWARTSTQENRSRSVSKHTAGLSSGTMRAVVWSYPVSVFQCIQLSCWIVSQWFLCCDLFQHLRNKKKLLFFNLRK